MDRSSIKANARQVIRSSNPSILLASLIMTVIGIVITSLSNRLTGLSPDDAIRYLQYVENGNPDAAINLLLSAAPSGGAQLINLFLNCMTIILNLGFLIFLLNSLRGTSPVLGNLLDGFAYWWKVLVLDLVCGLFIFLWSLLLIVPGIIAAYRYSMAQYLLITRPELGIMDCIRESKRLTSGWKGELFVLDLSFIGWSLLGLIPVLGWLLLIWVTPYQQLSRLQYYEAIGGYQPRRRDPGDDDEWGDEGSDDWNA